MSETVDDDNAGADDMDDVERATTIAALRLFPDSYAEYVSEGKWVPFYYHRRMAEVVADRLAAGSARLIFRAPPRHAKSEFLSWWTPTWFIDNWPDQRVILASYGAELAEGFGKRVRNTLDSSRRALSRLAPDSKAANRWNTPQGGGMMCVGIDGSIVGFGGNVIIVDDPHKNWDEAKKKGHRDKAYDFFSTTLYSRKEPKASFIITQQSLDSDDLSNRLIHDHPDDWEVFDMPALAEPGDWLGREPGAALCPQRYDVDELAEIRRGLPRDSWMAMFQQNAEDTVAGKLYGRFKIALHERKRLPLRRDLPLQLAFDFNVNPGGHCIVGQYDRRRDLFTANFEIHGPRMKTGEMMNAFGMLVRQLGGWQWPVCEIYGDRSGKTEDTRTTTTDYTIIHQWLERAKIPHTLHVPSANPPIKSRIDAVQEALLDSEGVVHYLIDSDLCPRLLTDFKNLKPDADGITDKTDRELSHPCLVADTLVDTERGQIPIRDVIIGDRAMTRCGPRTVTHSWMSHPSAEIWEVEFEGGQMIRGTYNHPVWIEGQGFVEIRDLVVGSIACIAYPYESCETQDAEKSKSSTPAECGRDTLTPSSEVIDFTTKAKNSGCTSSSTRKSSERFLAGTTSTTKTKIQITTELETSSACRDESIAACTVLNPSTSAGSRSIFPPLASPLPSGTALPRVRRGTKSTPPTQDSGDRSHTAAGAIIAGPLTSAADQGTDSSVRRTASLRRGERPDSTTSPENACTAESGSRSTDTQKPSVAPARVVSVRRTTAREPVYDLTVDDQHEFFANGVLVSNSDAEGYRIYRQRPVRRQVIEPFRFRTGTEAAAGAMRPQRVATQRVARGGYERSFTGSQLRSMMGPRFVGRQ